MNRIYLDNNATTPTDDKVLEEMLPYFDRKFANPLSLHFMGKEAKEALELARRRVAEAIDCDYSEVIFTSGGSESNNTVIKGLFFANDQKGHIITSTVEHPAVFQTCKELEKLGAEVTYIGVDEYGLVNPEEVKKAIKKNTILVSIMHGNNEVGTLEPVDEIARICNEEDVSFHTDAVQSIGKVPISVKKSNYDFLSLSAHKFNGPKGVGALIARKGKKNRFEPLLYGGGHEGGLRASTHNVPGIVGLGFAIELATHTMVDEMRRVKKLRDALGKGILENIPDTELLGHPEKRLPTTLNIAFKYIEGEGILLHLSNQGIAVSTGSACASGKLEPSHVIINMGFPAEIAQGAVRFSLGKINTQNDVDRVMEVLPPIITRLREISPLTPEDYSK